MVFFMKAYLENLISGEVGITAGRVDFFSKINKRVGTIIRDPRVSK